MITPELQSTSGGSCGRHTALVLGQVEYRHTPGVFLPGCPENGLSRCIMTKDFCMLFMIIERFKDNDMLPIYKRLRDDGRSLPHGLTYIDSWIEPNFSRCFQLMDCADLRLLQQWTVSWRGLGVTFEIVPVVSSKDTREVVAPLLDSV